MILTAEQRLKRAHIQLGNTDSPFMALAGVMMVGKSSIADGAKHLAWTNGRDCFYTREFVNQLNEKELNYVVAHETLHKQMLHAVILNKLRQYAYKNGYAKHFAAAIDYVVNAAIHTIDPQCALTQMPAPPLSSWFDLRFAAMSVTQVFEILVRENPDKPPKGKEFDEHDFEALQDMTPDELKEFTEEIDCAMRQGVQAAKRAGKGSRTIDEMLVPQVDWKQALRDLAKAICKGGDLATWNRPNKRFAYSGMMLPSRIALRCDPIVVAPDTSGSISDDVVQAFMAEIISIAQELEPERMDVLVWGSNVVQHETYERGQYEQLRGVQELKDGGGTDPNCIIGYIKDHALKPEATIILTDGEFDDVSHDWVGEVVWCVVDNRQFTPPVGRVVHIVL